MFTLFGVYFAWVGVETGSICFGAILAAGCGHALALLINIGAQLEDPFNAGSTDDHVHVLRDLSEVLDTITNDGRVGAPSLDTEAVKAMAEQVTSLESQAVALGVEMMPMI